MNGRNDTTVTNNAPSKSEFYVLQYSDGNSGVEEAFNTFEEAEDAGDRIWYRLSKGDRKKYCDTTKGSYFHIALVDLDWD